MEKYACTVWFSKRTWFYQRIIQFIYTRMEQCLSNTNIHMFHAYQENMAPCTACGFAGIKMGAVFRIINSFDTP